MERDVSGNRDQRPSSPPNPAPATPDRKSRRTGTTRWLRLAGLCIYVLIFEVIIFAPFSFTHGWSVGWPVRPRIVMSIGVTAIISIFLMTLAVAAGGLVVAIGARFRIGDEDQWRLFWRWVCITAMLVACIGFLVFQSVYMQASDD